MSRKLIARRVATAEAIPVPDYVHLKVPDIAGIGELTESDINLTPHQEYILWHNWVVEISAWVSERSRQNVCPAETYKAKSLTNLTPTGTSGLRHTLPNMTKNCHHLRCSMLALSARQLERKDGSLPAATSLALYQEAIHRLVPRLHTKDVSVVASCVVLCVLEMLSCKSSDFGHELGALTRAGLT